MRKRKSKSILSPSIRSYPIFHSNFPKRLFLMQASLEHVGLGSSSSMDSFASWKMNDSGMEKGKERGDATSRRR